MSLSNLRNMTISLNLSLNPKISKSNHLRVRANFKILT